MTRDIPAHLPVRILFQDEGRFGRISDTCRCWVPLPARAFVGHQVIREYIYGFMAVSPVDGRCASLILPWVDTATMSIFLAHTAQEFEGDLCVMLIDSAGWHHANELRVPANIRLLFLPPYSSEMNPVEHIWDHLREYYFGNDPLPDLDTAADRLCAGLRTLIFQPDLVQSLTCFSWIKTLCMTLN